MTFTRQNPSPRYRELEALYKTMHEEGDRLGQLPPDQTFSGISLQPHLQSIDGLIRRFRAATLLDYGCGKAEGYRATFQRPDGRKVQGLQELWNLRQVTLYDPGYAPYSAYPQGRFDAVVNTDVLEHIPEEDIDWILAEMFGFASSFLFTAIACYPAKKILPNGMNAHITLKSPGWWLDKLERARGTRGPDLRYFAVIYREDARSQVFAEG